MVSRKALSKPKGRIKKLKALIFDLDGTRYVPKGCGRRLFLACPWEFPLIRAEGRIRKALVGADYGSPEAY
jgi:hypothetical protein